MKQKLIEWKGEKDKSTTVAGNFNSPLTIELLNRKISKNIEELNNLPTGFHTNRKLHPRTGEYTLFKGMWVNNLNKVKKNWNLQSSLTITELD